MTYVRGVVVLALVSLLVGGALRSVVWAQDITTNLTMYWKMDEGAGTTLGDATGNNHPGTFLAAPAAPTWLTSGCHSGACISCDGGDQVTFTAITTGTTYTLSFWIYPLTPTVSYGSIINHDGNRGVYIRGPAAGADQRKISVFYSAADHHSAVAVADLTWSHVVLSVNAGAGTFYINNAAQGTFAAAVTFNLGFVCNDDASEALLGRLDDLRLYVGRALSAADVNALFNFSDTVAARARRVLQY